MSTLAVPVEHQKKALTLGVLAALALRAIFIALGAALPDAFSFMFLMFGVLLLRAALPPQDRSVQDNVVIALAGARGRSPSATTAGGSSRAPAAGAC
jgi:tellurite resistance protein TerC